METQIFIIEIFQPGILQISMKLLKKVKMVLIETVAEDKEKRKVSKRKYTLMHSTCLTDIVGSFFCLCV